MRVLGSRGLSELSIAAINQDANMSQGAFYIYFRDREDIIRQVAEETENALLQEMDDLGVGLSDPAERIAYAIHRWIAFCTANPIIGWVYVRLGEMHTGDLTQTGRPLEQSPMWKDIAAGEVDGRFLVTLDRTIIDGIRALSVGAVRQRLRGEGPECADRAVELVMRMLGIGLSEAHWLSKRCRKQATPS
jgi:AcrR family transcriptional regulator